MDKKKINSKILGKEFEVEGYQKDDNFIVSAKSFDDIFNEIEETIKLEYTPLIQPPIVGYQLKISDDQGREVYGFGSITLTEEAHGSIASRNAVATAASRAKSDAFIRYLGFPERVYSEYCIPMPLQEPEITTSVPKFNPQTPKPYKPVAAAPEAEDVVTEEEIPFEEDLPVEDIPFEEPAETGDSDAGNFVVNFGSYSGKTIREIYEAEKKKGKDDTNNWVSWLVSQASMRSPAAKEAQKYAKAFLGM